MDAEATGQIHREVSWAKRAGQEALPMAGVGVGLWPRAARGGAGQRSLCSPGLRKPSPMPQQPVWPVLLDTLGTSPGLT